MKGKSIQVSRIQPNNNNTNFTSIRFTKSAKNHIENTFTLDELKALNKLVKEHKNISPNVLVGTDYNLFGSPRLRTRIDHEEIFDDSIFFEDGYYFLKECADYAKEIHKKTRKFYF